MTTKLIVNSDDFGAWPEVNSAVLKARRNGVLTSASLMVSAGSAAEAVSIARDDPGLAVGLHLTLTNGRSVLPFNKIPDLLDSNGCFFDNPILAGFKYYFNKRAREQLKLEIEAQFQAFVETGLPLSHVDGHQHMHMHPAVLPIVVGCAQRYGAHGIRVPCDPFLMNLKIDRSRVSYKTGVALGHSYLKYLSRRIILQSSLARCDMTIGCMMSGRMGAGYIMQVLKAIKGKSVEIFLHPADCEYSLDPFGPNPVDFHTLISQDLKEQITSPGYRLTNYSGLREDGNDYG